MVNLENSDIKISLFERIKVNSYIVPDYVSKKLGIGNCKSGKKRTFKGMWNRHVERYHKLLFMLENYEGDSRRRVLELESATRCGKVRISCARNRNPIYKDN